MRLRQQAPLPRVAGAVDLYSMGQDYLFASGLSYCPRPIIQSYSACTPELARLNTAWLRSGQAAPNLFFAIQSVDERIPSRVDGLSWPELLTLYDIKGHLTKSRLTCGYCDRRLPENTALSRFGK